MKENQRIQRFRPEVICVFVEVFCVFYRKYKMYFSLQGYILMSYNLMGIYSIILISPTKPCRGNLLILKTFTLIAIPVRLLWVSLCRFTKHCICIGTPWKESDC